jgi:hypothetical protein
MLSTLLRPKKRRTDKSPYSSPFESSPLAVRNDYDQRNDNEDADDYDEDDGGEDDLDAPLLPIFSAAHLGVCYSITCTLTNADVEQQTNCPYTTSPTLAAY